MNIKYRRSGILDRTTATPCQRYMRWLYCTECLNSGGSLSPFIMSWMFFPLPPFFRWTLGGDWQKQVLQYVKMYKAEKNHEKID